MQMSENIRKQLEEMANAEQEWREEIKANPLAQYSTSQLKAELRRRKKEGVK